MGDGWVNTSESAVAADLGGGHRIGAGRPFAAGDIDNDGDTDILFLLPGVAGRP